MRGRLARSFQFSVPGVVEVEPLADEAHLCGMHHVVVPVAGIRPRGDQAHDGRARQRFSPRLRYPFADLSAIGRVHEHDSRPGLREPVVVLRVEGVALRARLIRARIEREPELGVEGVEEILRCRPLISGRGEQASVSRPHEDSDQVEHRRALRRPQGPRSKGRRWRAERRTWRTRRTRGICRFGVQGRSRRTARYSI